MTDTTEQAVAEFLANGGKIQKMPKRSATGPSIVKIREALNKGQAITFKRGPSGRTVTFSTASDTLQGKAAREHLRAAAKRGRRRKRRSAINHGPA